MVPEVGSCSLMPKAVLKGQCHWCTTALPKGRLRWCSDACRVEYETNHRWEMARRRRVQVDDGVCQHCGVKTRSEYWIGWKDHPEWPTETDWLKNHEAVQKFRKRFCLPVTAEVNHKTPRNGDGYGWGCWNHVDDLETLCHACHVKETKKQRAERRLEEAAAVERMERTNGGSARDRSPRQSDGVAAKTEGAAPGGEGPPRLALLQGGRS